jgi:hypothetical protein
MEGVGGVTEILRDIDKWNEERLHLWIRDSVTRYQIADQSESQAFANTLSVLMFVLAKTITLTDAPATEAGDRLANAIDMLRKIKRKREAYGGKEP